jgi:hypothetical protein
MDDFGLKLDQNWMQALNFKVLMGSGVVALV